MLFFFYVFLYIVLYIYIFCLKFLFWVLVKLYFVGIIVIGLYGRKYGIKDFMFVFLCLYLEI